MPTLRLVFALLFLLCGCSDNVQTNPANNSLSGNNSVPTKNNTVNNDSAVTPEPCLANDTTRCATDSLLESCIDGHWIGSECPGITRCDAGACLPVICDPSDTSETTCIDTFTLSICPDPGTRREHIACDSGPCRDGECTAGCTPGARRCDGELVFECDDDFTEKLVESCESVNHCHDGKCLTNCEIISRKRGYIGCSYVAADLPNDSSAIDNVFAFTFSNATLGQTATVRVTAPWGAVNTVTVPPGELAVHPLPVPRVASAITSPGITNAAFFIESDEPIMAVMFNPLEKYDIQSSSSVATNDASLLIPTTALGHDHWAMTWSDPGQYSLPPFVVVIADQDDTLIRVTAKEHIALPGTPYAAVRNTPTEITLQRGEVLNLEPSSLPGHRADMAGTRVESLNHPIAVFSGNRCARVPDTGRFCDHVETQVPPVTSLGTRHVVTRFTERGGEKDYLRVIATADGTTLSFDPPRADVPPTLNAGAVYTFDTDENFVLTTSHPILLGQFMASQNMTAPDGNFGQSQNCPYEIGGSCIGDPALVLPAPVGQWRHDLIFLVPETYRYQFVNIAFEHGTEIQLNGELIDLTDAQPIGASEFMAITLPMSPGHQTIIGTRPLTAIVYGYDHNISYAYNAGLDF